MSAVFTTPSQLVSAQMNVWTGWSATRRPLPLWK